MLNTIIRADIIVDINNAINVDHAWACFYKYLEDMGCYVEVKDAWLEDAYEVD